MTLLDAKPNTKYRITEVLGQGKEKRRMLDMGFTPNCEIVVTNVAPFGGTILVTLRGFSIALREDAARIVAVEVQ